MSKSSGAFAYSHVIVNNCIYTIEIQLRLVFRHVRPKVLLRSQFVLLNLGSDLRGL